MTTPLQSPQYAALQTAKEAHSKAHATLELKAKEFLAESPDAFYVTHVRLLRAAQAYELAKMDVTSTELDLDKAQAAFDAAYPAPADVVAAVEAVKSGHEAIASLKARLDETMTDEQRELMEAIESQTRKNDERVTHAKTLITEAQVSPDKAFVVKRSEKAKGSPYTIAQAGLTRFLKIDEAALAKWAIQNPDEAANVVDEVEASVSVAFYAAKL